MSVSLSPLGGAGWQFLDNSGNVLSGGKLYVYSAGTTTPVTTYTSSAGTTPNSNPVVLDSTGRVSEEIWVTQGAAYKFVLKTSADVLIWSKDNISGINDFSGLIGTYVVAADLANTTDPAKGDALVGFRQSDNSGNLTGAVGRTVHQKLQEIVSFKDFGAVGDGVTDDTVSVQAAITAGAGKIIDGQNLTYKITATLTGSASDTKIQNAFFDFSALPNTGGVDKCIDYSGSLGTPVALTADTLRLTGVITVASTSGFAANDLVFLKSNSVWDSNTSTTFGQFARIKTVSSLTEIILYSNVLLDFTTAASATIAKVTPVKNVVFDNIEIIGTGIAGQSQAGIYLSYGENCNILHSRFRAIDYVSVALWRCYASIIDGCYQRNANNTGNAYAYGVWGGCYGVSIVNSYGEDNRHTVTIGDNDGINMFTKVIGCQAISSKDAGIDSHSASMYSEFINNYVEMSKDRFLTSNHDGMINEGCHAVFIGNTVIGAKGSCITHDAINQAGYYSTVKIIGNTCISDDVGYGSTATSTGIYVFNHPTYGANIDSVIIDGNSFRGGLNATVGHYHIHVNAAKANNSIKNIVITNNTSTEPAKTYACLIQSSGATSVIENVVISNNNFKFSGARGIYFLSGGATSNIKYISGGNNNINGPGSGTGIYFNDSVGNIENIRFGQNTYNGVAQTINEANALNYIFADADTNGTQTFTGGSATITGLYNWYIWNRAATNTVNLPDATTSKGLLLRVKNIAAGALVSASSNVCPIDSAAAGTAILPATAGAWATLYCDGTNWVIMAQG